MVFVVGCKMLQEIKFWFIWHIDPQKKRDDCATGKRDGWVNQPDSGATELGSLTRTQWKPEQLRTQYHSRTPQSDPYLWCILSSLSLCFFFVLLHPLSPSLFFFLSFLSFFLSFSLSLFLSLSLHIYLSSIYLSTCLPICLSIYPPISIYEVTHTVLQMLSVC